MLPSILERRLSLRRTPMTAGELSGVVAAWAAKATMEIHTGIGRHPATVVRTQRCSSGRKPVDGSPRCFYSGLLHTDHDWIAGAAKIIELHRDRRS